MELNEVMKKRRKVVCRIDRIDEHDFFGMLMATVDTDIIGAVNFKYVE